jgi:hypothetical protein
MKMTRENRDDAVYQTQCNASRFFWVLTGLWHKEKKGKGVGEEFWTGLKQALHDFDKAHPEDHRPENLRPRYRTPFPEPAPLQVMVASGPSVPQTVRFVSPVQPPQSTAPSPAPVKAPAPPSHTLPTPKVKPKPAPPPASSPAPLPVTAPPLAQVKPRPKRKVVLVPVPPPQEAVAPALAPQTAQLVPVSAPVPIPSPGRQDKGKGKMVQPMPEVEEEEEGEEEEGEEEDEREKDKDQVPVTPRDKTRPAPITTDRHHEPACQRCVRAKRECLEQAGAGTACFWCAKVKMRCLPANETDGEGEKVATMAPTAKSAPPTGSSKKAAPKRKPAPKRQRAPKAKPAPNPKPAPKAQPAPKRKPAQKPPPAPAAGTSKPRARVIKSAPVVLSSEDEEDEMEDDGEYNNIFCLKYISNIEDRHRQSGTGTRHQYRCPHCLGQ